MLRALAALRLVLLAYAVFWTSTSRWGRYDEGHPTLTIVALGLLTAWTVFALWAYEQPSRRTPALLAADLAVALSAMLVTPYLQEAGRVDATLPTFWVFGVVIAWAVRFHAVGGLFAAAAVTVAELSVKADGDLGEVLSGTTLQNVMLLWIGGGIIGYLTGLLQRMAADRDLAERRAAAVEERARLARAVHDGTLQVLAMVQRRGQEQGGELADLGQLAGKQEAALRALIQGDAAALPPSGASLGTEDLMTRLRAFQSTTVSVSGPGAPVVLPARLVGEVSAAVSECLTNVCRHVGLEAPAWVLVEDLGSSVVVTVRDEGQGIAEHRLETARTEGRLGVVESICGRLSALGGSARLTTAPGQGVEWELSVPREASRRAASL